ncbi:hypothetical protein FOB64_006462 [Candida albicans]|uniref:Large ribosomal subunit protein bL21m n=1 Tax=Candida albicans TaxID=5476 RepID=A0A8H6BR37_CANAX|nr:hypothetical protein FOB64_006462 [Candida albicans]
MWTVYYNEILIIGIRGSINILSTNYVQIGVKDNKTISWVNATRLYSVANASTTTTITTTSSSPLSTLKLSSNVTKGDKVYLPYKLKNASVGDVLNLNDVVTLGSPQYTLNMKEGISPELFDLKASVVEITKEPRYQVTRKKQRCRTTKTTQVEPFQTVLMINELKLK